MYTHMYIGGGYLGFLNENARYSHAKTSKHARKNTSTHAHTHAQHTRHQCTPADSMMKSRDILSPDIGPGIRTQDSVATSG